MFENASFFQRKPDRVRAFRLTAEGNVPVTYAEEPWLKAAIAERRLTRGPEGGWFVRQEPAGNSVWTSGVYPGDWLVRHDSDGRLEAMTDERFRGLFDAYDPEEDS